MTTRSLIIRTGGVCERRETEARETASEVFGDLTLEVITVRHPMVRRNSHVLFIDDWGAVKELPLNVKAWALYGGSPVFGDAVLGEDDHLPLNEEMLELIEDDERFPDPIIKAQMRQFLTKEGYTKHSV